MGVAHASTVLTHKPRIAFGHHLPGDLDRRRGASGDDSGCRASPVFVRVRRAEVPMLLGLKPGLKGFEEK